jgi:hypothetical protein
MHWPGHRFALTLFASVLGLWLIGMMILMRQSALAPEATGTMLVVFNPGTPKDQAFAAIINSGAKPIRETTFGFIWVVTGNAVGMAGKLQQNGALGAYRDLPISPTIAGCVAVADAKVADAFGLQ